ncbi:MAG: 4Fe-4S binding protein [Proteobacteria bacterium]|nr:4Fe-4S binding protein [Pseudomonadota bacterium]
MASRQTKPVDEVPRIEVLDESDRNPGVRTVRVIRPEPQNASFFPATLKGLGVTLKHFTKNFFRSRPKGNTDIETLDYPAIPRSGEAFGDVRPDPETRPERFPDYYPDRFRGLHRLMKRDDGRVRCVACMCCPTVCPANCITIIPAETEDASVEKYPAVFEIDELRCVVCGLCVEACPCDAIRMDTGMHAPPVEERGQAIWTKDKMLETKPVHRKRDATSIATQGGVGPDWRDTE